ncbi:ectoine/hydroxyectoine ABC transporter permease subunit EhuC [Paenibacillus apiarius]|uniref:Ectoine/hydroxyectoine ABC transporter permease subunit EhuC n=1 Tax=Paenibacillus apiarius TaxID=46240 RepID=A0ABT4DSZ4_9BACL|nr:ectoine/hydroxyectoine ABC transporter permease subunit EhuC [Paenibacillus apiarius]MCY9513820.1 ectoine/hydroxyectoine ABC transporter permease subunit EhuC [Paenibacillus apiarius]MCY9520480.1 ectoine/hydroxyectoine ABC transporter permease subunit EhuC [Paenibacillus apiarius]MCY9550613.1 ectoine/hydroxyectoine ABC transporter permease subunit EhuC [Paenibacillus apiarius]MCY9559134.1 ectoine/hydroxyectoine ABC transporter permease subunit EhuC [Paenibacillus apiarius]MCY9683071.1 ectoi
MGTLVTLAEFLPTLLRGAWVTLQLVFFSTILAFISAFLAGGMRLSKHRSIRFASMVYVEVFRGTSLLVQLFWLYFALPMLLDIRMSAMTAAVLALGLNYGAYGSEVVRGAILSISKGQYEAAAALNMSPWLRMRRIILPQAMVLMLPSFGNLQIELLKGTSLVYLITLMDLTYQGMVLRSFDNSRTTEIFALMLLIYFIMAYSLTLGIRYLERRAVKGRV